MRRWAALALLLAGCDQPEAAGEQAGAGANLEAAAVAAGLVPDPETASIIGSWARESDRLCIAPQDGEAQRIGVAVDYGPGNGCLASGTVRRSGDRLRIDFGRCEIEAKFDGEQIMFPAEVGEGCAGLCSGAATLAALTVDRVSESAAEAGAMRAPSGRRMCPD